MKHLIGAGEHPDDVKDEVSFVFRLLLCHENRGHCVGGTSIKVCARFCLGRRVAVSVSPDAMTYMHSNTGARDRGSRAFHATRLVMCASDVVMFPGSD